VTSRDTLASNALGFGWTVSRDISAGTDTYTRPLRTLTVGFDATGEEVTSAESSDGTYVPATVAGVQLALNPQA